MAYASAGNIEAKHYNNLVWGSDAGGTLVTNTNNLNLLWGAGYGKKGYGQDMTSVLGLPGSINGISASGTTYTDRVGTMTAVTPATNSRTLDGDNVKAQQWIGLISSLNRILYHQSAANVTLSPYSNPAFGGDIVAYSTLQAGLNTAASNQTNGARRNNYALSISGPAATSIIQSSAFQVYTGSVTRTVTWNSANDVRWFWNAGGYIQVDITGASSSSDRSIALSGVINALGTTKFYGSSNTGPSNNSQSGSSSTAGYWNIGNSAKLIGTWTSGSSTYSGTYASLYAWVDSSSGTEDGAVGRTFKFRLDWSSDFGGQGSLSAWNTDNLSVSAQIAITIFDPVGSGSGQMLSKNWTDPTITN
jgi:hypothetical protein